MTQPETAVSSVAAPEGNAAPPTIEERFAVHTRDMIPDEEETPQEPDDGTFEEGETGPEQVAEADDADVEAEAEPDLPPIKAPASWTAEEQAEFGELPRALQETVTRREAEREKFVQAKSQEAARVRTELEATALAEVSQLAQAQIQRLQNLLPEIPEKPSAWLQVNNPQQWAEQTEVYEWAVAQHEAVQHDIQQTAMLAQTAEQERVSREHALNVSILAEQFPEYLSADTAPVQRKLLGSIATELGFSIADLANPTARDILALRKVSELKTKADKYDKLMAERMQHVRSGKQLPKVSRPGQPQGADVVNAKRLEADRQAMRSGDKDAAARVFGRHIR